MTVIITTPNIVIEHKILEAFTVNVNKLLRNKIKTMTGEIKSLVGNALRASRTFNDILTGDLRGHFGIPAGEEYSRLNQIVNAISDAVYVDYKPFRVNNRQITGSMTINVQKSDLTDILNLPSSVINTPNGNLYWLNWLLTEGDSIIVTDFHIAFKSTSTSRSGMALMIKKIGGVWRVPSQYSGTIDDNWITRVLDSLENDISNIIIKNLT